MRVYMINKNYNYLDIKNQPFLVDLISYGTILKAIPNSLFLYLSIFVF